MHSAIGTAKAIAWPEFRRKVSDGLAGPQGFDPVQSQLRQRPGVVAAYFRPPLWSHSAGVAAVGAPGLRTFRIYLGLERGLALSRPPPREVADSLFDGDPRLDSTVCQVGCGVGRQRLVWFLVERAADAHVEDASAVLGHAVIGGVQLEAGNVVLGEFKDFPYVAVVSFLEVSDVFDGDYFWQEGCGPIKGDAEFVVGARTVLTIIV